MYKPAPSRHKKTSIVRTRTGCKTCRERKKKCDEKQPACSTCVRLGKRCERYKAGFCFKNVSFESPESPQVNIDRTSEPSASPEKDLSTPVADVTPDSAPPDDANLPEIELQPVGEALSASLLGQIIQHASEPLGPGTDDLYPTPDTSLLDETLATWTHDPEDGALPLLADQSWALAPSPLGLGDVANTMTLGDCGSPNQRDTETQLLFHAVQNMLSLDTSTLTLSSNFTAIDDPTPEDTIVSYIPREPSLFSGNSQQLVYTDFWDRQCLPALHPIFTYFPTLGNLPPVITDTMMALSAGRLSRLLPQRKTFELPSIPGLSFRPDSGHKTSSQKYYYSALRRISDLVQQSSSDSVVTLAVLILFCYWETSMGSFRDFAIHSDGATKLIQTQERTLLQQGTVGAGLMAAWVRAQMNNWWRRMHFSTPEFQRKQAPMSIEPDVEASLCTAGDRKALVLVILCESLRIYSSAVVYLWDVLGRDEDGEPRAVSADSSDGDACLRPYASLMRSQSRKLSDWHTNVPLSELPITSFQAAKPVVVDENTLTAEPLRFQTHDAAMNYAYYITSRIMQSSGVLHAYDDTAPASANEGAEQWILILLRIAAGIDWEECIRLNTYSIGFSGLLLTCAVQSRKPAVGLWIQDWLEERQRTNHLEEGSFPVLQILQVLRAVNRERARGRDVFAVFQTVDDGGGEGKFHSYHSQTLTSVMVYARSSEGEVLSYSIPV